MVHTRFVQAYSSIAIGTGVLSVLHDVMLVFVFQNKYFDLTVNFLFILLFFLSILAIGMYHFWHEEKKLFYLPRFFLGMFFVGLIGSILLLSFSVTVGLGYILTLSSILFAVGLVSLGVYSLKFSKENFAHKK